MTKSMDETIAELRRLLVQDPSANRWWELVSLLHEMDCSEGNLLVDYVKQHVQGSEGWRRASVPCGAWTRELLGWSLSESIMAIKRKRLILSPKSVNMSLKKS